MEAEAGRKERRGLGEARTWGGRDREDKKQRQVLAMMYGRQSTRDSDGARGTATECEGQRRSVRDSDGA